MCWGVGREYLAPGVPQAAVIGNSGQGWIAHRESAAGPSRPLRNRGAGPSRLAPRRVLELPLGRSAIRPTEGFYGAVAPVISDGIGGRSGISKSNGLVSPREIGLHLSSLCRWPSMAIPVSHGLHGWQPSNPAASLSAFPCPLFARGRQSEPSSGRPRLLLRVHPRESEAMCS